MHAWPVWRGPVLSEVEGALAREKHSQHQKPKNHLAAEVSERQSRSNPRPFRNTVKLKGRVRGRPRHTVPRHTIFGPACRRL